MGIFSGILCFICFCLLSAKAISVNLHLKKADKVLMKLHKPLSVCLIIVCLVHILSVIPVLKNRSHLVLISGIASTALMILLIFLCHAIKDRKHKMRWHKILTILMGISIIGHFITYVIDFNDYRQKIAGITFDEIDLENVEDGIYRGEYDAGYIYAKVEVEVKDGAIISIHLLEHRNERGKRAESILDTVISEQKIDADAVSGATNSSKVIKKAIETALTKNESG